MKHEGIETDKEREKIKAQNRKILDKYYAFSLFYYFEFSDTLIDVTLIEYLP
jgi:hypothetical protein